MSDNKPNSPDFKEISATAGKLFTELKNMLSKVVVDIIAKLPKSEPEQPSAPADKVEPKTTSKCDIQQSVAPKIDVVTPVEDHSDMSSKVTSESEVSESKVEKDSEHPK